VPTDLGEGRREGLADHHAADELATHIAHQERGGYPARLKADALTAGLQTIQISVPRLTRPPAEQEREALLGHLPVRLEGDCSILHPQRSKTHRWHAPMVPSRSAWFVAKRASEQPKPRDRKQVWCWEAGAETTPRDRHVTAPAGSILAGK
jgi:hypothetical protein